MSLNEKQKAFCEHYAACLNATEAAKRAGYSEKTSYSIGQRLLKNVEIQNYIQQLTKPAQKHRIATIQDVLEYLSNTMLNTEELTRERTKAAQQLWEILRLHEDDSEHIDEIIVTYEDASGDSDDETAH